MWKIARNLILTVTIIASAGVFFIATPTYVEAQAQTEYPESPSNRPEGAEPAQTKTESGKKVDLESELGFTKTAALVYNALTGIGSLFTYVGGMLLDVSLSWFVWGMADTTIQFGLKEVIETVWALIRDLFNLLFIFGLIYVGFQLILGIDDSTSKRTLGTIVVAALLINFSLYVAQVVVDFGNIAAVEISKQFEVSADSEVMGRPVFNIADSFLLATKLQNLSSSTLTNIAELSTGNQNNPPTKVDVAQALVIGLVVAIMLMIIGFVLMAGAFLMFLRYFYLIYLMMFSPLMVLGWVLPQFKSRSSDWWKTLIKQSLLGPAYLFMLYISLLALQAFETADIAKNPGITTFIMMSLIVSGFAWASLIVAQKIGAIGASQAMGMGQGLGRRARVLAGGASVGLAGRGLQNTFGKWAQNYAESDKGKRRAANSWIGKQAWNASRKLGDSSFDARKVGGVGKKLGLGAGIKGGYATKTKEIVKKEKQFAKDLGTLSDEDPQVQELQLTADATEQSIKDEKKKLQNLRNSLKGKTDEEEIRGINANIEAAKANVEDLEEKHKNQKENLQRERHSLQLGSMSTTQQENIQAYKNDMKKALIKYEKAPDEASKKIYAKQIANLKKAIEEEEKQTGGYATKVENKFAPGSKLWLLFQGRNVKQNQKAAEEIRKEYKNKIKGKEQDKPKEPKESKGEGETKDKDE